MWRVASFFVLALTACFETQDDPTTVKDLRVLGISFETPEVLIEKCDASLLSRLTDDSFVLPPDVLQEIVKAASRPVTMTALIEDPLGEGRQLQYRIAACADLADEECDDKGQFVELGRGETNAGELSIKVALGSLALPDGTPLLQAVLLKDPYKGLGGFRVPTVLEVSTEDDDERVYARKRMVYMCQFFAEMRENVTPKLPDIKVYGALWPPEHLVVFSGREAIKLEAPDFSALEEDYILPSLQLAPIKLKEAWKISWYTTSGTMRFHNTGGVNFAGEAGRHQNEWHPDAMATTALDVEFIFVVRDGRGGTSWTRRQLRWVPEAETPTQEP